MNQWISRGTEIDGIKIGFLCYGDEDWQVLNTSEENKKILFIKGAIYNQIKDEIKKIVFKSFGQYKYFITQNEYLVTSLKNGPYPEKEIDIINFAMVLKKFKNKLETFSDLLYIEELELIIPIQNKKDEQQNFANLFTMWITSGVNIDITKNLERVSKLLPWLPLENLQKITEIAGLEITNGDIEEQIEKSTIEKPKEEFTLTGRKDLEKFFKENIIDVIFNSDKYERVGIGFPAATILYGKPGCGKTYAVDKLIEYLGFPCFYISSSTIGSPYIHDTAKKVANIFEQAFKEAPSIIVIDEMEAFLSERDGDSSNKSHLEEVAEFLRLIPKAIHEKVLVIAMTNMIEGIDPAILRTGRFDYKIEVKMASKEEIEEMIRNKIQNLPCAKDIQYKEIAKKLEGRPLSDVTYAIREAGKASVKQNKDVIDQECFNIALENLNNSTYQKENRKIGFQIKGETNENK